MIKINLLPIKEIQKRLRRRREVFFLASTLAALLLVLAAIALTLFARINGLNGEISELEKEKVSYQAIQRQITTLQKQREELEIKITAIKQLRASSQLPVRVMDEVSERTPSQRLWLNSMRVSGSTLTIAGVGLDNPTIAQYMQALERSPYFNGVDLASTAQTEVGGQKLKSFSLTIRISPPPEDLSPPEDQQANPPDKAS